MIIENYIYIVFILSLAGTIFALYMSIHRAITKTCAFNEECPEFLGYPACYFGLLMFLVMLIASTLSVWNNLAVTITKQTLIVVSTFGIVFAGSYVVNDVREWLVNGRNYGLILPSCAYGLVFYILILIISLL